VALLHFLRAAFSLRLCISFRARKLLQWDKMAPKKTFFS
jgi:hypothetical protein